MSRSRGGAAASPLLLILHGREATNQEIRDQVAALRDAGHRVTVRVTWEGGDAREFARRGAREGFGTVVAGGGDGTASEVAAGLVAADLGDETPALALLPLGTGNDFATACGIPGDIAAALDLAASGARAPIDLGRVGDRTFLNMVTGGFGSRITAETPEELKRLLGRAAYFLTGLSRFGSVGAAAVRCHGPGFSWRGELLGLAVGNGSQAGGGYRLCPEAAVDDGLLDIAILPSEGQADLATALGAFLQRGSPAGEEMLVRGRVERLELQAPSGLHLSVDGEPLEATEVRFEVLKRRLRLAVPDDSPLLAG